jgi:tetratricopeptide (TPR) repeat protein
MQQEDNDPMGLGSTYNNIGVIYQYQEDYKKALTLHQKGLEQYTKAKNKLGIAKSYSNLGIVYMGLQNFEKSLECHFKANQSFVELDYTRGISNTLNNIGTVYYKMMSFEKALEFFWKSSDIQKKMATLMDMQQVWQILVKFKSRKTG